MASGAIEVGIVGTAEVVVEASNTAKSMGSGSLEVFATPAMIALVEKAACNALQGKLEEGKTSVGTHVDVKHKAPSGVGRTVTATVTLTEVDRRALTFSVLVNDGVADVGSGTHSRFIVDEARFMKKVSGAQ